ncbi:MAG TPA: hypothetical protein VFI38_13390 [Candidatus Acidoferrum sp.]|nr:hypothetical protein [Candidatus Acidoferrum sp.]
MTQPVFSGFLSGDAVDGSGAAPADSGIAAADVAGSVSTEFAMFHSGGFWLLVVLIVGTAWYLDSKKREDS